MTEVRSGTTDPVPHTFPQRDGLERLNALVGKRWNWWFPQSSAFDGIADDLLSRDPCKQLPRIKYADWLKELNAFGKAGVYIWLVPRPGNRGNRRLVHVGRTKGSMLERTREHCRNQFRSSRRTDTPTCNAEWCTMDRIYMLPLGISADHDFGSLAKCRCLWDGDDIKDQTSGQPSVEERFAAAKEFLRHLRVVYLTPQVTPEQAATQIKWMEAVIGVAAAQLLQPTPDVDANKCSETTNTLTGEMATLRNRYSPLKVDELTAVARWLNVIEEMLPEKP